MIISDYSEFIFTKLTKIWIKNQLKTILTKNSLIISKVFHDALPSNISTYIFAWYFSSILYIIFGVVSVISSYYPLHWMERISISNPAFPVDIRHGCYILFDVSYWKTSLNYISYRMTKKYCLLDEWTSSSN